MKNKLTICLALIGIVFLFNYTTEESVHIKMLSGGGDRPDLPAIAYDYSFTDFPTHYSAHSDSIQMGYDAWVDSHRLDSLEFIHDQKATLGRVLFYDNILSTNMDIACATCHHHDKSFTDGRQFSEGMSGLTNRNSLHLNDIAWDTHFNYSWDGSKSTLHEMISLPLNDDNEIGIEMDVVIDRMWNTSFYPALFQGAYQHPLATEEKIIDALVHFIASMHTLNSKLDQQAAVGFQNLTFLEYVGKDLFSQKCASCHHQGVGDFLSVARIQNGLELDIDDIGAGVWDTTKNYLFRMPSLKNIALTAPYMHDGRFATLEDVIDHYSEDIVEPLNDIGWSSRILPIGGFNFTQHEKDALKAFLRTLTDQSFIENPKWADPFCRTTSTDNVESDLNISFAPNPMSDYSTIYFDNPTNLDVSISTYNQSGELLYKDTTTGSSFTLNKRGLVSGVYYVHISVGNKTSVRKLVVA